MEGLMGSQTEVQYLVYENESQCRKRTILRGLQLMASESLG
jgi:hypothetical protein